MCILLEFCRQINREEQFSQVALNPSFLWIESINLIYRFFSSVIGNSTHGNVS